MKKSELNPNELTVQSVEASGEAEGAPRATSAPPGGGRHILTIAVPDPEVSEKQARRRFTAQ